MKCLLLVSFCWLGMAFAAPALDLTYYLPHVDRYDPKVPTPESYLGYQVGEWHVRHDQLLGYLRLLARHSSRIEMETIGTTHERRELVQLMISHPDNLAKVDELRRERLKWIETGEAARSASQFPVVVWLCYSIHGNEASGSNAALLTAYHLAAAQDIDPLLRNTIILLDPSLNPDGLGRFTSWVNTHRGRQLSALRDSREHQEAWPRGRTNHYWFDLNRDWLLLQQPESKARVDFYQKWQPNVLADFHEMGSGSTYFFQPGVPSRQNPLTSETNLQLTRRIARYHANALDQLGELYFSEQFFDDFFFGKGSTYPDIQGAVGILFEQASARGHLKERFDGTLSFPEAIRNHLTTSLSTLAGALENRELLVRYQRDSHLESLALAKKSAIKAYVFGDDGDPARAWMMADVLRAHRIQVFPLARSVRGGNVVIDSGYVVPTEQPQFRLIQSIFETRTEFKDRSFYDITAWNFPNAFGLPYLPLDTAAFSKQLLGDPKSSKGLPAGAFRNSQEVYAYLVDWKGYFAPALAYDLLDAGVAVWSAGKSFQARVQDGRRAFEPGTLMVPLGSQSVSRERIETLLRRAAQHQAVRIDAVSSGLTAEGIDLGSPSFTHLKLPEIVLVVGSKVFPNSAGELWHLLDHELGFRVHLVESDRLAKLDWSRMTHLILPDGCRDCLPDLTQSRIRTWLNEGGVVISIAGAVRQLVSTKWVPLKVSDRNSILENGSSREPVVPRPWGDRAGFLAEQRIAGTIFGGTLDLSHPLGFGFQRPDVALFRDHTLVLEADDNPFSSPIRYDAAPLVSGYASTENLNRIAGTPALTTRQAGKGLVVVIMDNPTFRGFWRGAQKIVLNSLFFSSKVLGQ